MDYEKIERSEKRRQIFGKGVIYLFLTVWALIVLFPFYWMLLTSVKSYSSYNAEHIPTFFTLTPTLQNYADAFTAVPLGKYLLNTLIFTVATTAIMMVVITLSAFAFARLEFRGKNLAFTLFLSLMMIPNELVIITNFVTITNLDMRNTFLGLILPSVTSVFYIYLLKENFEQVPDELYRAAKVDGTSDLKYLCKVMIPICKPTMVTIAILKVIECWNSYIWPRLITDDQNYYLVSNGIQEIRENGFGRENVPAMMAAVVVISPAPDHFVPAFQKQDYVRSFKRRYKRMRLFRQKHPGAFHKKPFLLFSLAALSSVTLLTGCHGAKDQSAFTIPGEFDTSRDYEITFWAKNDTNKTQTEIYKKAISDFEALYPNITVDLRLYTDYGKIYNDVITNIATGTTPNVCITYPDHIATYLTGSDTVVPLDDLMADSSYGLAATTLRSPQ